MGSPWGSVLGNPRNSFLNSVVCDSSNAQGGPLPKDTGVSTLKVIIYPNPFNSIINIASNKDSGFVGKTLNLYTITGKLVLTKNIQSQNTILHAEGLPSGIYILKIEGKNGGMVYKLIKQAGATGN